MARKTAQLVTPAPKKVLSADAARRGIDRLEQRITELEAFNVATVPEGNSPALTALSTAIRDTLDRCFGEGTSTFSRFVGATALQFRPMMFTDSYPQRHHYQEGARTKIEESVALLREAQRTLREDLADAEHDAGTAAVVVEERPLTRKIFVVHGHDDGAREAVARFLERLGFDPVVLHEQANRGRTIIEKIEEHGDVDFAAVLLTPDDLGCAAGGTPGPRARQNVLLELGYFIGRLGRERVCALKKGELDIPTDFAGRVADDG